MSESINQTFVKPCKVNLRDVLQDKNSPKQIANAPFERRLRDRSTIKKPNPLGRLYSVKRELESYRKTGVPVKQLNSEGMKITQFYNISPKPKKIKTETQPKANESDYMDKSNDSDIENENSAEKNDYAVMVAKNIESKMAFLQSLNIPQAKQELISHLPSKKIITRGIVVKKLKKVSPVEKRISKRLQRLEPDGQPLTDEIKPKSYQPFNSSDPYKTYTPRLPVTNPLGLKQTCTPTDVDMVEQFLNGLTGDLVPHIQEDVVYNKETMSRMVNNEELIAKVVPDRIYSLAVHPGATRRKLVAAGGRTGYLGLWDVGSSEGQDGVFLFRPCHDSINCLAFESKSLVCCSYEGTLKKMDLELGEFHHLYATPDDVITRCTHFDTLSDNSYIISHSTGCVVTIDTRTPGTKDEIEMVCHEKPVKTVSVHPIKKDYFLTAANDGTARLWDIRCLKALSPVASINQSRSINCAYFSPVTGNSFLTLSYDDTVKVFDCTDLGPAMKQTMSIRHDNQVGRWVTPFRGQWVPNQDQLLAVGSKKYPRDIGVFDVSTRSEQHSFTSDYLGAIVPIITFHPKIPFVAGGNASGKVYIFTEVNA